MINILYQDNHILVVEKPINVAVMADESKDNDLLNQLKQYIKRQDNKPGNVYLALVHRLDRPVGGVMVFAKTSKAAARLSKAIQQHQFKKIYNAIIVGQMEKDSDTLIDYLYKDKNKNTVYVCDKDHKDAKYCQLNYQQLKTSNNLSLVQIELITGRSHQIRVQFASRNKPLWGDQRYNKQAHCGQQIALFAKSLSFPHPITKEILTFTLPLPDRFPYDLF